MDVYVIIYQLKRKFVLDYSLGADEGSLLDTSEGLSFNLRLSGGSQNIVNAIHEIQEDVRIANELGRFGPANDFLCLRVVSLLKKYKGERIS